MPVVLKLDFKIKKSVDRNVLMFNWIDFLERQPNVTFSEKNAAKSPESPVNK